MATYDEIKSAIGGAITDKDIKELSQVVARSTKLTWDEKTRLREMLQQKIPGQRIAGLRGECIPRTSGRGVGQEHGRH